MILHGYGTVLCVLSDTPAMYQLVWSVSQAYLPALQVSLILLICCFLCYVDWALLFILLVNCTPYPTRSHPTRPHSTLPYPTPYHTLPNPTLQNPYPTPHHPTLSCPPLRGSWPTARRQRSRRGRGSRRGLRRGGRVACRDAQHGHGRRPGRRGSWGLRRR